MNGNTVADRLNTIITSNGYHVHVPPTVVDVSAIFPPEVIGNALAKLWVVDGQKLAPRVCISGDVECPITLQPIEQAALLCDGTVYEEAAIKQWLVDNNTVPCTNLPLDHRKILRLHPLKAAVEQFLSQNDMLHMFQPCSISAIKKNLEHATWESQSLQRRRYCADIRAEVLKLETLESHIVSAEAEMEMLRDLIAEARETACEVTSHVDAVKLTCAVRLQSFIRGFLAKRETKRRKIAKVSAKYGLTPDPYSLSTLQRSSLSAYVPTPMSRYAFPYGDGECAPPSVPITRPVPMFPYVYPGGIDGRQITSPVPLLEVQLAQLRSGHTARSQSSTEYRRPYEHTDANKRLPEYWQYEDWVPCPTVGYGAPFAYVPPAITYAAPICAYAPPVLTSSSSTSEMPPNIPLPSHSNSQGEQPEAPPLGYASPAAPPAGTMPSYAPPTYSYVPPAVTYAAPTYPAYVPPVLTSSSSTSEMPQIIPLPSRSSSQGEQLVTSREPRDAPAFSYASAGALESWEMLGVGEIRGGIYAPLHAYLPPLLTSSSSTSEVPQNVPLPSHSNSQAEQPEVSHEPMDASTPSRDHNSDEDHLSFEVMM